MSKDVELAVERKGNVIARVLVVCSVIAIALLVGIVFSRPIKRGIDAFLGKESFKSPAALRQQSQNDAGDSQVGQRDMIEQLQEHVSDTTSNLRALITLLTLIVVFIGGAAGLSVLWTAKRAQDIVGTYFDSRRDEFEREIDSKLGNLLRGYMNSLTEAHTAIWDDLSQQIKELDEARLATTNLTQKERGDIVAQKARERKVRHEVTRYCVFLASNHEDYVVNAAQHLPEVGAKEGSVVLEALPYLREALNRWRAGSKARGAIQRAIQKLGKK